MSTRKSITITLSILLALVLATLAGRGLLARSEKGNADRNHALIIGISKYDSWPKLEDPSKDAKEIARILLEKYDFKKENVVLLTDDTQKKPTRVTILTYLDKYVSELTDKDNLLVFFSGRSTEDERGNTYWIPKDGGKKTKMTWLNHKNLCSEFFASEDFKAKSVCIISDSLFSQKLIRSSAVKLFPSDLRYPEKIREKALRKSRESISFGDKYWPATKRTEGFGLFTYLFRRALLNNWLKVVDLENLIFTEKAIFEASKIAGTRLLRGRLRKTPMEKGGQTIITRVISPPKVNVVEANVSPQKGYQGDKFIVEAKTSSPAFEVYVEVSGREYPMEGSGTRWKYAMKVASLGKVPFKVKAINADDVEGIPRTGLVTTMKRAANLVNVSDAQVNPKRGWGGNEYRFMATTDGPARKVALIVKGKRFEMKGSGTRWSLKKIVEDVGTLDFTIIATNDDGAEGRPKGAILVIKAPLVDIAEMKATPETGYAGEEFVITARSDRPAGSVSLQIDGVTYNMEGSGVNWTLKKRIQDVGKKKFTVTAKNVEGQTGFPKSGNILTRKRPVAAPNVASVDVSPKKPYANETFAVNVKTNIPADEVYVEIEGKKHVMEGAGTQWKYMTQIAGIGTSRFKVVAINKEGKQGLPLSRDILTRKRPLPVPNVAAVSISPRKPLTEETFAIRVETTAPADQVFLEIRGKRHIMEGSGTQWKYLTQMAGVGTNKFKVTAKNKDGMQGEVKTGAVTIGKRIAKAVDVVVADVSPGTGAPGDLYSFKAATNSPARSVAVIIEDKRYAMIGSGTNWSLKKKIKDFGSLSYSIIAKNKDGIEGGSKIGTLVIKALPVNVVEVKSTPDTGFAGDDFTIAVKTDRGASSVSVEIDGVSYKMQGSGKKWRFKKEIKDIGKKKFTVIAKNVEGLTGLPMSVAILTKKRPLLIADVKSVQVNVVSPGKGYVGDSFLIKARTTQSSEEVFVEVDGKRFAMEGSGTKWEYVARIDKLGTSKYKVIAHNRAGEPGLAKTGDILTRKKPVAVPQVASVDVSVVSPGKGYVGDNFLIKVNTTSPSEEVFVEIEGQRLAMDGAGTQWKYLAQIDRLGTSRFKVVAKNKEGKQGQAREGEIKTVKRPTALVNVAMTEVTPKKGYIGGQFTFNARTDSPATGVTLVIGKDRYEMTGSGSEWSLSRKIKNKGEFVFYVVAKNEDGVEGGSKTAELIVAELKQPFTFNKDGTITDQRTGEVKKRFRDNGDGTVTDLGTNLMWLKTPKQIALNYENAVEYCQKLKFKGYEGWRLPTIGEWKRLIDKKKQNPSLPPGNPFVNIPTRTGFWSKTKHKFGALYVYQVSLWYGKTGHLSKKKNGNVWPVRYAEAPK